MTTPHFKPGDRVHQRDGALLGVVDRVGSPHLKIEVRWADGSTSRHEARTLVRAHAYVLGCQSPNHDAGQCWGRLRTCAGCKRRVCYEDGAADGLDDCLPEVKEVRRHGGDGGLCDSCAAAVNTAVQP